MVVSGQIPLFGLHQMIQVVMGWENSHLHQFIVGKTYYGEPDPEYGDTTKDHRRVRLRAIARVPLLLFGDVRVVRLLVPSP